MWRKGGRKEKAEGIERGGEKEEERKHTGEEQTGRKRSAPPCCGQNPSRGLRKNLNPQTWDELSWRPVQTVS